MMKERTYKSPTRAAQHRAKAHALIVHELTRLAGNLRAQGLPAIATVIQEEANRHQRMIDLYQYRYGPNASI